MRNPHRSKRARIKSRSDDATKFRAPYTSNRRRFRKLLYDKQPVGGRPQRTIARHRQRSPSLICTGREYSESRTLIQWEGYKKVRDFERFRSAQDNWSGDGQTQALFQPSDWNVINPLPRNNQRRGVTEKGREKSTQRSFYNRTKPETGEYGFMNILKSDQTENRYRHRFMVHRLNRRFNGLNHIFNI